MSPPLNRRAFLEQAAAGTAAFSLDPAGLFRPAPPAMAIATWKEGGEDPESIRHEAVRLTEEAIRAMGGMGRFISRGDVVWVKPNIGWDRRPEQAANTNPDVVATLVRLCLEAGAAKVRVSDNPCNDERRTFVRSGIQAAAEAAGAEVFFLDRRKFREMEIGGRSLNRWLLYTDYVECDKRINVPIAKHHNLTGLTLAFKNLMGILGGDRSRIHQNLGPAMADVARFVPSELTVLDAIRILTGNGPQGGSLSDVARRDTLVASTDPVALEAFGATLFSQSADRLTTARAGAALELGTLDWASLDPVRLSVS